MTRSQRLLITLAGAAALLAGGATYAQDGGRCEGPGPGARPAHMMRGGQPGGGMFSEQHLTRLKADLKITAAQEGAWTAFSGKATEQAKAMQAQREQAGKATPPATTPERMAQRLQMLKQQQASLEVMSAATKSLYDVLTPEQRTTLDRLSPAGGEHRGGPGGPGEGRRHGPDRG